MVGKLCDKSETDRRGEMEGQEGFARTVSAEQNDLNRGERL